MKKILLYLCLSLCATTIPAQINYQPTDPDNPIAFDGKILIYKGDTIILGPKTFFIDGSLPDSIAQTFPYVYTSMNEAVSHLTPGSAEEPMTLYSPPGSIGSTIPTTPRYAVRNKAVRPTVSSYAAPGCLSKV